MKTSKEIIIQELNEGVHQVELEDVIFDALDSYYKNRQHIQPTFEEIVAKELVDKMKVVDQRKSRV